MLRTAGGQHRPRHRSGGLPSDPVDELHRLRIPLRLQRVARRTPALPSGPTTAVGGPWYEQARALNTGPLAEHSSGARPLPPRDQSPPRTSARKRTDPQETRLMLTVAHRSFDEMLELVHVRAANQLPDRIVHVSDMRMARPPHVPLELPREEAARVPGRRPLGHVVPPRSRARSAPASSSADSPGCRDTSRSARTAMTPMKQTV